MCFVQSSSPSVKKQEPVERHEADASLTKTSKKTDSLRGYQENIKGVFGSFDNTENKKTLLGE